MRRTRRSALRSALTRIRGTALMIATASLLHGCAVMSQSDCEHADWRRLGLRDGSAGQPGSLFDERRVTCEKNGTRVDAEAYRFGYAEGQRLYCTAPRGQAMGAQGEPIPEACAGPQGAAFMQGFNVGVQAFCTPRGGFERGRAGLAYHEVCPPNVAAAVMGGYRLGREIHDLRQRLEVLPADMGRQKAIIDDPKSSDDARRAAHRRLLDLQVEEKNLRHMIGDAELRALYIPGA